MTKSPLAHSVLFHITVMTAALATTLAMVGGLEHLADSGWQRGLGGMLARQAAQPVLAAAPVLRVQA